MNLTIRISLTLLLVLQKVMRACHLVYKTQIYGTLKLSIKIPKLSNIKLNPHKHKFFV